MRPMRKPNDNPVDLTTLGAATSLPPPDHEIYRETMGPELSTRYDPLAFWLVQVHLAKLEIDNEDLRERVAALENKTP